MKKHICPYCDTEYEEVITHVSKNGVRPVDAVVSLPPDIIDFIYSITLDLQKSRSKTDDEFTEMFNKAYRLYEKYNVEKLRSS